LSARDHEPFQQQFSDNVDRLVEGIMSISSRLSDFPSFCLRSTGRHMVAGFLCSFILSATAAHAQSAPGLLVTRAELVAAATRAETAATTGDPSQRTQNAMIAAAIRQRLHDGDLQVGDRVVVTIVSDAVHRDTVVVRSERTLELPGMIVVPVAGVLRSELQERVSSEVLKYIKAQQVEVTPLMRVGVLGAVTRPGYFAFASDLPLSDAIMGAGGPTGTADVGRTTVRRRNQEFRSAGETSKAIAGGLTLDQFGLAAGDELVVGQHSEIGGRLLGMTGALASVLTLFVALHRH
jgi:protein involved in polysaccharide export with SLBB domain